MVVLKVLAILFLIAVGFVANKVGWIPLDSSRVLSRIVVNIATPCLAVVAMAEQDVTPENALIVLYCCLIALGGYLVSWLIAQVFLRVAKIPPDERGLYINTLMYSNNGFMGMPVAYAVFGSVGFFYMVMIGCWAQPILYTIGTAYFRSDGVLRGRISTGAAKKSSFWQHLNPPIIGTIIGLAVFFTDVPIAGFIEDVLTLIGSMMTPLSMIVVGVQLAQSDVRSVVGNFRASAVTVLRLVLIPLLAFFVLRVLIRNEMLMAVGVLNFAFPVAAILPAVAEQYGANAKLTAEITFLSTLFSVVAVPLWVLFLSPYAAAQ